MRYHTDTYDVPDTNDADADTDDDAGPCEDIVVLAKTHRGASEDTYCGTATIISSEIPLLPCRAST